VKILVWFIVLIAVFCFSYVHAADPILIRTDCFDASLTYGTNSLENEEYIHWVRIADFRIKEAIVKLRFSTQDMNGLEESGLLIPNDMSNGHTIYFSERWVRFSIEVLHNEEVQFVIEYVNF